MQLFLIINNIGIMINADVNVKNSLIKEYVIKDLLGILVTVNVIVMNYVILESVQIIKIFNTEND